MRIFIKREIKSSKWKECYVTFVYANVIPSKRLYGHNSDNKFPISTVAHGSVNFTYYYMAVL